MKIAQIAPLVESVPPKFYGGTERIVSYLTEELVRLGHDVTLFASGDSETAARLIACSPRSLRFDPNVREALPYLMVMLEEVRQRAHEFDILHFHIDLIHFPIFREMANRTLTTLHGRLDLPELQPFYRAFADMPLVSISDKQRAPMPPVRWVATIQHGLPPDLCRCRTQAGGGGQYVAFLGRLCPEKRPDRAIAIARAAGIPLKIAAKVDPVDVAYFADRIAPLLDDPLVEYIGEIADAEKCEFLGNARALLLPGDWPEPFGLVMIEAMACGTPVIAFPCGSVPEVVEDGVTGFIVADVAAAAAVARAGDLDRRRVRERFDQRFTVGRMAQDYLGVYGRLLAEGPLSQVA